MKKDLPTLGAYEDYPVYSGDDLGVTVADGKTCFVLWTPVAEAVQIRIYDNGENGDPERIITMDKDADTGVFRAVVSEELYGKYYTYQILKDKKWLSETPGIWAKGPTNIPIIPINLNPVYIAIKVNIGCIPIFPLTILGSRNCLTTDIIIHKTIIDIPSFKSPFNADIIAHGTITVPDPNIGSASTNPIANAINNGYFISIPITFNKYNPITDIINDININVASAFKYPPKLKVISLICFPSLRTHFCGI